MNDNTPKKRFRFSTGTLIAAFLIVMLLQQYILSPLLGKSVEIPYSDFKTALRSGEVVSVTISAGQITGQKADETTFSTFRVEDSNLIQELEAHNVEIQGVAENDGGIIGALISWLLPIGIMIAFWYWMMNRSKTGGGLGGLFSFGKSKARMVKGEQSGVSFKEVGGAGEAITELREVTEFLKDPSRFQHLGGRMPKGVLLLGPPGTGKRLLARAAAGEANVPFFSLSGSEFVEMFVGVGASRVRDLFEQAKKNAPSIIFIDEIDTIGGRRAGAGAMGSHEEREQTLNQLLAEMDGFEGASGVIVIGATNRPEILDPALLRPGRFDRQITVGLPDLVGRQEILQIHTQTVKLSPEVSLVDVARITSGFSGADLANLVNEAALLAARRGKIEVEMSDFDSAFERVVAGSERRTQAINPQEKRIVAYHEAGHALVSSLLPGADPVHKVTIVPRGRALGYTMQRPTEDRYLLSEAELQSRLAVLLGGRVAEALTFGEISTGAADDLARATDLARRMVTEYGMSPSLGPVRLAADPQAVYLGNQAGLDSRVSPKTASQVDNETRRIVEEAVSHAWDLLEAHQEALNRLAEQLCERETVGGDEVRALVARSLPVETHGELE